MTNGNGDINQQFIGDGTSSNPSQAFFYEQNTGIYHDTSNYPTTAWEVVKRGNKRIRVDDNKTYLYGTVAIDNLVPGTTGDTITLSAGSVTSPSLNFTGDSQTGLYQPSTGQIGLTASGTSLLTGGATELDVRVPIVSTSRINAPSFYNNDISGPSTGMTFPATNQVEISCNNTNIMTLTNSSVTTNQPLTCPSGSNTTPSLNFTGDTNTGIYSAGTGGVNVTCSGTEKLEISPTGVHALGQISADQDVAAAGSFIGTQFTSEAHVNRFLAFDAFSATTPSFSFLSDLTTGVYRPSTGTVSVTTSGTEQLRVGATSVQSFLPLIGPVGSSSAPTYAFAGDTNTGIYHPSAGNIGMVCAGLGVLNVNNASFSVSKQINANNGLVVTGNTVQSTGQIQGGTDSVTTPVYTWSGDTTTGLYHPTASQIGVSCAGTNILTLTSSGLKTNETITTITGPTAGTVTCSMPFQGPNFKLVSLNFNAYVNNTVTPQTYTYPTVFLKTPNMAIVSTPGGLNSVITSTSITFAPNNATVYTGTFLIIGD